jgi:phenylacetate-CoA ligase
MAKIVGRSDDMLIIRGVNVFPSQIEELILKIRGLSAYYQLEVTRESNLDSLAVHVECADGQEIGGDARETLELQLARDIKAYVGVTVAVSVLPIGAIERSVGKAKRVIDKRRH